jgi:hypothetical protein
MSPSPKAAKKSGAGLFSDEEKAAMREAIRERKAQASKEDGERNVIAAIAKMPGPDRAMAKRFHALVKANAPGLAARTWYGMPAYANEEGTVLCFFRNASKFKTRYATIGFSDEAKLDDGHLWPTDFAITELTDAEEARLVALVKRAVG